MTKDPDSRWKLFRPLDLAVAAALLALAAVFLPQLVSPFGSRAEVTVEGRKVARLTLDGPRRELSVATALGPLRLAYGEGRVQVTSAPCPGRLCLKSGGVSRAGASIVCVPCRFRVEVSGDAGKGVDAVTY